MVMTFDAAAWTIDNRKPNRCVTTPTDHECFLFRSMVQQCLSITDDDPGASISGQARRGPLNKSLPVSLTINEDDAPPLSRIASLKLLSRAVSTSELTNELKYRCKGERNLATSVESQGRESKKRLDTSVESYDEDTDDVDAVDDDEESPRSTMTKISSTPVKRHPRNAAKYTVVAFVNSISGGGEGKAIFACLQGHLGESNVIDLHSCRPGNMPEDALLKYAHDSMVRVLACGGDGTCGWILSSLDKVWSSILRDEEGSSPGPLHLSNYKNHLPLAIMPLGTGNDLSREFGWGGAFKKSMKDKSMIKLVERAKLTQLDTWRCIIMPIHNLDDDEKQLIPKILETTRIDNNRNIEEGMSLIRRQSTSELMQSMLTDEKPRVTSKKKNLPVPLTEIFDGSFCNYFSLGFDATIAYRFHREREAHPENFTSPLKNKLIYVKESPYALLTPTLRKRINVLVNNEKGHLTKLKVPKRCRAIVVLNIHSYAGGHQLSSKGSPDDGLVEVIFVSNLLRMGASTLSPVMPFLLFEVAAQTNNVCLRTRCPLHCQIDGEPWLQGEGVIQIKFHSRKSILKNVSDKATCGCMGTDIEDTVIN